ncbi:type II toxin-antitoxin system VapC family toxin [Candidatus Parcubacteria bacterium]|nr:MAG: type II toxin-antitoxin system VapC family toxin [Candidatus Parcubacteria bacterium]
MKPEHVFIDTNVFLRYILNDVPEQADAVERLLHRAARGEIALITNSMVIAEIVWTLESFYRVPKEQVQRVVLGILNTPGLDVADADLVLLAIDAHVTKNVDFIDAYNAAWCLKHGIEAVCTFDRKHFSRLEGISVQVPTSQSPQ